MLSKGNLKKQNVLILQTYWSKTSTECQVNKSKGAKGVLVHLVQIDPVPDNTDEEADPKQSAELYEPGHL